MNGENSPTDCENSAFIDNKDQPSKVNVFSREILKWWKKNKLTFPWRSYKSHFSILVAEILLRKTNAEKVERFIGGVLDNIDSPEALLNMPEKELEALLQPFGMQKKKTFELKKLADVLEEQFGGSLPTSYDEIIELPGIGRYIASAYVCFGLGKKKAVVDTNVIRTYERVFGLKSKRARPRDDVRIWEFAEKILPSRRFKSYNYALIDFSKKICRARNPLCLQCPISFLCNAFEEGKIDSRGSDKTRNLRTN